MKLESPSNEQKEKYSADLTTLKNSKTMDCHTRNKPFKKGEKLESFVFSPPHSYVFLLIDLLY